MPAAANDKLLVDLQQLVPCASGPGWRGAVEILSNMPKVDVALLESGEFNKG